MWALKPNSAPQDQNYYCISGLLHVEYCVLFILFFESAWLIRQLFLYWTDFHSMDFATGIFALTLLYHFISLTFLFLGILKRLQRFILPEIVAQIGGLIVIVITCVSKIHKLVTSDYAVTFEYDKDELPNDFFTIAWLIALTGFAIGLKFWCYVTLKSYFYYLKMKAPKTHFDKPFFILR